MKKKSGRLGADKSVIITEVQMMGGYSRPRKQAEQKPLGTRIWGLAVRKLIWLKPNEKQ